MPDPPSPKIPPASIQKRKRRLSSVWLIPILAIGLGLWLVWNHYQSQGPLVTVLFETGEGVVAGKTKVQCRSVDVGTVESVRLSDDLQGVVTVLRINQDAARLLRDDSRFWIVRPRVDGGAGISGLGTIVSGSYIELDPGVSDAISREFTGLEQPPVTPLSVPGLRITLVAEEAGSLGSGSPIFYKGITVGRIESRDFHADSGQVNFNVFIEAEFANLVTEHTRFWNLSGFDLNVSADGFRLRTGSLGTLLVGGVEFGLAAGGTERAGRQVADGAIFPLHEDREGPSEIAINPTLTYMLLFEDSVRGLRALAPVEFRGIRVGAVSDISFDHYPDDPKHRVPVLIRVDPKLIAHHAEHATDAGEASMAACVQEGLRATLKTGSLLTGQLFVDLDFHPDASPEEVLQLGEYATLPTASSGLARIEDKLVQVLDKIEALPVETMLNNASDVLLTLNEATVEAEHTLASLTKASQGIEKLLADNATQTLPQTVQDTLATIQSTLEGVGQNSLLYKDLFRTLDELRDSLSSIRQLVDTVERKPNSLIFGRGAATPATPRAKR